MRIDLLHVPIPLYLTLRNSVHVVNQRDNNLLWNLSADESFHFRLEASNKNLKYNDSLLPVLIRGPMFRLMQNSHLHLLLGICSVSGALCTSTDMTVVMMDLEKELEDYEHLEYQVLFQVGF